MLGSYIKHDGWSTYDIDKFNSATHKSMAIQNIFVNFNINWNNLYVQTSNIVSRGATPMISLMPKGSRNADTLAAIAAGEEDVFLHSWISSFKAWRESYPEEQRPVILLRFGHEFNGNWYPWGNRPEAFKAAWRHVHAMFEAAGANDGVEWVWCASATDVDDYRDIRVYYPGDDVVDWTGLDGYNWGNNYSWSSWRNFDQVFSYAYNRLVQNYPEKPIVLAEVASAEPGDQPDPSWGQFGNDNDANESKDAWVADMMNRIEDSYPAIRAITWFNNNKEVSWALNETAKSGYPNTGLTGYNQGIQSDHFKSDFTRLGFDFPEQQAALSTQQRVAQSPAPANFYMKLLDILIATAHAKQVDVPGKAKGKGKDKSEKLTKKQLKEKLTGLQRALAVSKKPKTVGKALRDEQAKGMKKMPKKYLKKIAESRMQLGE
ncbi:MAG: glycoside hydrolase family 26 protein [Thiolinea sp.]